MQNIENSAWHPENGNKFRCCSSAIVVTEKSRLKAVGIKTNPFRNCSGENREINSELEYITVSHFYHLMVSHIPHQGMKLPSPLPCLPTNIPLATLMGPGLVTDPP